MQSLNEQLQDQTIDLLKRVPYLAVAMSFATCYGLFKLSKRVYQLSNFFYRHMIRPQKDLYQRYAGKDSYAVITGGSDGIGLEICHQMAALGFNICIIARNKEKIEEKLKEIEKKFEGKIKTMAIVADFA